MQSKFSLLQDFVVCVLLCSLVDRTHGIQCATNEHMLTYVASFKRARRKLEEKREREMQVPSACNVLSTTLPALFQILAVQSRL